MAEYKMRGLPIEFDKLPLVKMPEGHLEYWTGKNHSGLPPRLPEGSDNTRPNFNKGGKVQKHGTSTSVAGLCRDTKTIKC
jgi:hypothetical protein